MLSLAETQAVQLLAAKGRVTEVNMPEMTLDDFERLSAKINAARERDTDRYEQNEDGTWKVVPE